MSKDIRDKERELFNKWSYLKELSKDEKIGRDKTYEIRDAEDELYKKWLFYRGFLNTNEKKRKK